MVLIKTLLKAPSSFEEESTTRREPHLVEASKSLHRVELDHIANPVCDGHFFISAPGAGASISVRIQARIFLDPADFSSFSIEKQSVVWAVPIEGGTNTEGTKFLGRAISSPNTYMKELAQNYAATEDFIKHLQIEKSFCEDPVQKFLELISEASDIVNPGISALLKTMAHLSLSEQAELRELEKQADKLTLSFTTKMQELLENKVNNTLQKVENLFLESSALGSPRSTFQGIEDDLNESVINNVDVFTSLISLPADQMLPFESIQLRAELIKSRLSTAQSSVLMIQQSTPTGTSEDVAIGGVKMKATISPHSFKEDEHTVNKLLAQLSLPDGKHAYGEMAMVELPGGSRLYPLTTLIGGTCDVVITGLTAQGVPLCERSSHPLGNDVSGFLKECRSIFLDSKDPPELHAVAMWLYELYQYLAPGAPAGKVFINSPWSDLKKRPSDQPIEDKLEFVRQEANRATTRYLLVCSQRYGFNFNTSHDSDLSQLTVLLHAKTQLKINFKILRDVSSSKNQLDKKISPAGDLVFVESLEPIAYSISGVHLLAAILASTEKIKGKPKLQDSFLIGTKIEVPPKLADTALIEMGQTDLQEHGRIWLYRVKEKGKGKGSK